MIAGILIPITFFVITGLILYYFMRTRHEERLQIINKGIDDEQVKYLLNYPKRPSDPLNSIKYGLLLISIGLAIFLGTYAPPHQQEEITFGFIFLLPGISLLIYYAIAKKHQSKESTDNVPDQTVS